MMFLKFVRTFFDSFVRDNYGDQEEQMARTKTLCVEAELNLKLYWYVLPAAVPIEWLDYDRLNRFIAAIGCN